jgi:hypothetical protein
MRMAELVVDYLELEAHPDPMFRYGGVFRTTPLSDAIFAGAEPPTHDDWVERGLNGTAKGVVQGARLFVRQKVAQLISPKPDSRGDSSKGLGALAVRLSGIVPALTLGGAGPATPTGGGGGGGKKPRPRIVGAPRTHLLDGVPYVVATVAVPPMERPHTLEAESFVVLDGGARETVPPPGESTPEILEWQSADTGRRTPGSRVELQADEPGTWYVFASHVPNAVVRFKLHSEEAPDGI